MFPITEDLKASLYKLNIPFFRDRNVTSKEEKSIQEQSQPQVQSQSQSHPTDERQEGDEQSLLTDESVIDSPYKLKVFGRESNSHIYIHTNNCKQLINRFEAWSN